MPNIVWDRLGHILEVAGKRSLGSVLRRIERELPDWVVVVRTRPERPDIYFYAFRPRELQWLASEYPERRFWSIERASEMHEWTSSGTARHGRIMGHTSARRAQPQVASSTLTPRAASWVSAKGRSTVPRGRCGARHR